MARKENPDLNANLDPQYFSVLIPRSSHIPGFGPIKKKEDFQEYVRQLSGQANKPDEDHTHLWRKAWRLEGSSALLHALYLHRQLEDTVLRLPGVSAFDVGFAIEERRREYANLLALRIHVRKKLPPELLQDLRTEDFSSVKYLVHTLLECLQSKTDATPKGLVAAVLAEDMLSNRSKYPEELDNAVNLRQTISKYLADSNKRSASTKALAEVVTALEGLAEQPESRAFLRRHFPRHPIVAINACDLDIHIEGLDTSMAPPEPGDFLKKIQDSDFEVRLTYCGVPFDVPGAEYAPTISPQRGPGIFVEARQTAIEICDQELLRTGRSRVEPLVGGVSVGGRLGTAGTLASVVWDRTDGKPCLLSNWHVLSGQVSARQGDPCYQPAIFDGGSEADIVGHLERWRLDENGDVALAKIACHRPYASLEVLGLWHPVSDTTSPELGMIVRKWGRTTGFTRGFVDGIQLAVNVDYGDGRVRAFRNQFHIASVQLGVPFSQPGDSGAMVVTNTRHSWVKKLWKILRNPTLAKEFCKRLEARLSTNNATTRLPQNPLSKEDLRDLINGVEAGQYGLRSRKQPKDENTRGIVENLLRELNFDVEQLKSQYQGTLDRGRKRSYQGVGLLFAGDTAGSPLGDFAVASDLERLEEELDFSLRPVFAPRSGFRKLQSEHTVADSVTATSDRRRRPGSLNQDPRGTGPQPDPEEAQTGPDSTP